MRITLDGIFSSGMVLQRGRTAKIWGCCPEGAAVSAALDGETCAVEREGGRFTVILPPQQASTDRTVAITCEDETVTLSDICFGDVFLLSGQSNMQLEVERVLDVSGKEVEEADFPLIRHFVVEPRYMFGHQAESLVANPWKKAVYPDVLDFSAAGFFFARRMHAELNVPIGLVLNAMGGSTIEAWLPEAELEQFGTCIDEIVRYYEPGVFESKLSSDEEANAEWHRSLDTPDEANTAAVMPEDAEKYTVPSMSFDTWLDGYTGSVWFYREVELTAAPEGEGFLYLGDIVDSDRTYVNGVFVGETSYRYPPRKYKIPAGVLHEGKNLIAARVVFDNKAGGFVPDHPYYLDSGTQRIDLCGEWRAKKETEAESAPPVLFPPLLPTGLYNASLYPLKGLNFNGMLWYQGESNTGDPARYSEKFTVMMNTWRTYLEQKLPVVCVELCDYVDPAVRVCDRSGWQEIQRQQREQPQHTPDCAVASARDLAENLELHPQRKQELGERLAKEMLTLAYGR